MQIRVELQPLVGIQSTQFGDVTVEHDVYTILGHVTTDAGRSELVELGQVGKKPGSPVTFRRDRTGQQFPQLFKDAALAEIARVHDQAGQSVNEQPAFADPEDDDLEDDDTVIDPDYAS